jgi:hypothetical protein
MYLTNHYSAFPGVQGTRPPRWSGRSFAAYCMPANEDGTLVSDIPDWRRDLVAVDDVHFSLDPGRASSTRCATAALAPARSL